MTSNDIYTPFIQDQYCVYHTIYSGSLMPANYIGSTYVDRILIQNYHGSVASKRYKAMWLSELKLHPELFSTVIVSYHDTRSNATHKELQLQKLFNVVKSDLFINRSYASVNSFCDTTFTPEEKESISKKISASTKGILRSDEAKLNMSYPKSEEHKANISASSKGKTKSTEHRANLSKSRTGKSIGPRTNETTSKIINTMLGKYGVANASQSKFIQDKKLKTLRLNYGVSHPSQILFLSIIDTKKTYSKGTLSRWYPEFKQYY